MARPNKMWYRQSRKAYFVTIKGQTYKLGTEEEAAKKEFHRLMSLDEPPPPPSEPLAVELLDKFLIWTQANRSEGTYDWYYKHIQSFIDALSNKLIEADKVKPHHVTEWCKKEWSASYTRGAMIAVQRAFRWSVAQGYIERSPVATLEKPSAERRDNCPTEADYQDMLKYAKGDFRDLVEFVWATGCRPHEAAILERRHFKGDRFEFPVKESKGKKRNRVIYLTDKAKAIVQSRLGTKSVVQSKGLETSDKDHVGDSNDMIFTNRSGRPWTRHAIDCGFKRIAKKTKKKFSLVDLRHGWATKMLEAGMDHVTLAAAMGHTSAAMVCKHYAHVGQNSDRLLKEVKKYAG